MSLSHQFHGTPAKLIWDVRYKFFGDKNVIGLLKNYHRKAKTSAWSAASQSNYIYNASKGIHKAFLMTNEKEYVSLITNNSDEVAFQGFHLLGETEWEVNKDEPTHDIPKCDMIFSADDFKSENVQKFLAEMKEYVDGADICLYKTTNSFHIYVAQVINCEGIKQWYQFLNEMSAKYPGVIDNAWLEVNSITCFQPLRISETYERRLPQLFAVL